MCQTSKNSWESNYAECRLIINPNGQLWYERRILTTLPPPDSALQSLLDSLQKNRCSALGWEINSYHSYVPKIQGPSAAVLRMLINSSPYAPIFLQFQSTAFSQDFGPSIFFESLWGKATRKCTLHGPRGEKKGLIWYALISSISHNVLMPPLSVVLIWPGRHSPDDKYNWNQTWRCLW